MAITTPATNGQRKIYHFDGGREMAAGLEALLSPELHHLEVQLPPIKFRGPNGKQRERSFDLRITFRDGYRRAVFVRNGTSLKKQTTQDEIDAIFAATPRSFADDKIVVNGDRYTQGYRDNLLHIWSVTEAKNPDIDSYVLHRARNTSFWFLQDLISQCDIPTGDAFDAILRLIGSSLLKTNLHNTICHHSRIWLP